VAASEPREVAQRVPVDRKHADRSAFIFISQSAQNIARLIRVAEIIRLYILDLLGSFSTKTGSFIRDRYHLYLGNRIAKFFFYPAPIAGKVIFDIRLVRFIKVKIDREVPGLSAQALRQAYSGAKQQRLFSALRCLANYKKSCF
jgi:hypothetical protein